MLQFQTQQKSSSAPVHGSKSYKTGNYTPGIHTVKSKKVSSILMDLQSSSKLLHSANSTQGGGGPVNPFFHNFKMRIHFLFLLGPPFVNS